MSNTIDILTVSLSIPAIVLCAMVLRHWFPESIRALRERRDAADWLVLGVTTSFTGVVINMTWWALHRVADIYGYSDIQLWMYSSGPVINLFTRQTAVIVAAFCHLKAYHMFSREGSRNSAYHFWWSLGAAVLAALTMFITAPGG